MQPEDKDAALLPRRIDGRLGSDSSPGLAIDGAHVDLLFARPAHWGSHKLMLEARRRRLVGCEQDRPLLPPIETPEGWLVIYHGVRQTPPARIYRLGLALFDLKHPSAA